MKKKLLIIIPALAAVTVAVVLGVIFMPGKGYSGTVTNDGKPLSGVSVSDGRNVAKTDENGAFKLKGYRKTRFITVTVPAGYTTENYYISADKDKSEGYDFTLEKSDIEKGQAHSFIQISDTEIGEKGVGEWIDFIIDTINEKNPAFLIHTGDICYIDGLKKHIEGMNSENMDVPVRYIIGNHDYVEGKYGEELFESIYGPVWYSFEVGNVHYVVTPFQTGGDYKSGYNKNDRWRWLENDLKNTDENMKVVIFNHTDSPSDDYVISFDRKKLDLKKHNLIAWVFGHYHHNYIEENDGVVNISTARPDCGGIDSSVSGLRIINISADGTVSADMAYYKFNSNPDAVESAVWTTQLEGRVLFCDTVLKDGFVYLGTVDDSYPINCGVTCLSALNGAVAWTYKTENTIKNNIIVEDGTVIIQDSAGNVYALDTYDGKELWKTKVDLGSALDTSSGICVSDGIVYTGSASGITALNIKTGEKVWENIRGYGEPSPAEFIVIGNKLIVNSHWDALVILDKDTGKQIFEIKDEDLRFRSSTPAVIDENTLLIADSDAIMTVDLNEGKIKTKKDVENYNFSSSAQPLIIGEKAYIPTANKGVVIYDINKDEIIKTVEVGSALIYTAPYTNSEAETVEPSILKLEDNTLVFGASDGKLYFMNPDGEITKTVGIGSPIFSKSATDGENIFVSDFSGRVICLKIKEGE